jgi:hypothetical protein
MRREYAAHERVAGRVAPTGRRSHRAFGIAFGAVVAAIGALPLLGGGELHRWALALGAVSIGLALVLPRSLALPSRLWGRAESRIQRVVSAAILFLLFFGVVTPMALLLRALRRDLLRLKRRREGPSHWTARRWPGPPAEMLENPF